ncbi:hypothetical protein CMV_017388 [Castanea mollissima]|uniref:Thioredoxin-disulfide reductase n=1 Tax=Castanea mollissima TaxID=60419 RepID=A0A8J4R5C2_9ROSI|nr:hypothetical protein CMV_017388 [Castanea mollissima]
MKVPGLCALYTAPTCGPCRTWKPILSKVIDEFDQNVHFVEIDIKEDTEIAEADGIMVQCSGTLKVFAPPEPPLSPVTKHHPNPSPKDSFPVLSVAPAQEHGTNWLWHRSEGLGVAWIPYFQYRVLQKDVMKINGSSRKKVRFFFSGSNPLLFRFKMAHKIKGVREKLDDISALKDEFNLAAQLEDRNPTVNRRDMTHSFVPSQNVIAKNIENVVIIGSGPAGYTAAIYSARANLKPLVFEGYQVGGVPGGQLMTTTEVENFPGFPDGITGPDLMDRMRRQAERWGAELFQEDVESIDVKSRPFTVQSSERKVKCHSVIFATGATAKRLGLPREDEFWSRGISACAICDGASPLFKGQVLAVVGGGDTATEEAIYLTKYARHVHLLVRRDQLKASKAMQDRVYNNPNITMHFNTETMYVGTAKTSVEGVFAAGDVQDHEWRQAVTAAGSGCVAALSVERYLVSKDLLIEFHQE